VADRDACHPLAGASSCPTITASGASSKGREHEAVPEKLEAHSSRLEAAQDVPGSAAQDVRVVETSREQEEERVERERHEEEESACSAFSRLHPMDDSDAALGRRGARRSLTTLAEPDNLELLLLAHLYGLGNQRWHSKK
jgi:hypothetical protein